MAKRPDPWPSGLAAAEKRLKVALKAEGKKRGFKFTSDVLWRQEGEFFIKETVLPMRDKMGAWAGPGVKPLASDDILWAILGMESNKDAYISLRAVGAFVGPSVRVGYDIKDISMRVFIDDESEIEAMACNIVEHLDSSSREFLDSINYDVRHYFELTSTGEPFLDNEHTLLYRCIAYIYLEEYEKAIELAERQIATGDDIFKFGVGSKGDATLVKEYCERMLAQKGATSC